MINYYLYTYERIRYVIDAIMLCISENCTAAECVGNGFTGAHNALLGVPMSILGVSIPEEWRDLWTIAMGIGTILIVMRVWEEHQNQKLRFEYMRHEAEKAKMEEVRRLEQLQAETERKIAQSHIKRLNAELDNKRDAMHRVLVERIELARHIREYAKTSGASIPKWLQQYLNTYSFANASKWQSFVEEFNSAYTGYLPYLQQHYPTLTDSDLQYIILATLGFDCADIAYLLGKTDRTIWNRRDIIKGRIGDTSLHLEEWLSEVVESYKGCLST